MSTLSQESASNNFALLAESSYHQHIQFHHHHQQSLFLNSCSSEHPTSHLHLQQQQQQQQQQAYQPLSELTYPHHQNSCYQQQQQQYLQQYQQDLPQCSSSSSSSNNSQSQHTTTFYLHQQQPACYEAPSHGLLSSSHYYQPSNVAFDDSSYPQQQQQQHDSVPSVALHYPYPSQPIGHDQLDTPPSLLEGPNASYQGGSYHSLGASATSTEGYSPPQSLPECSSYPTAASYFPSSSVQNYSAQQEVSTTTSQVVQFASSYPATGYHLQPYHQQVTSSISLAEKVDSQKVAEQSSQMNDELTTVMKRENKSHLQTPLPVCARGEQTHLKGVQEASTSIRSKCNGYQKQSMTKDACPSGKQQQVEGKGGRGEATGKRVLTGSIIARRKNATRETTAILKDWLFAHTHSPYPTKGEKLMLSVMTKMNLTQVSTWFANARRRMKKENKLLGWVNQPRPPVNGTAAGNGSGNSGVDRGVAAARLRYFIEKHAKLMNPATLLALANRLQGGTGSGGGSTNPFLWSVTSDSANQGQRQCTNTSRARAEACPFERTTAACPDRKEGAAKEEGERRDVKTGGSSSCCSSSISSRNPEKKLPTSTSSSSSSSEVTTTTETEKKSN